MGKKQQDDDEWETGEAAPANAGFFGFIFAFIASILALFGLDSTPGKTAPKKKEKKAKAPKAPKAPKPAQEVKEPNTDLLAAALADEQPEGEKKKKKKKKKAPKKGATAAPAPARMVAVDVDDGWETTDKKAKKAKNAAAAALAPAPVEEVWEEAPKKGKKSKKAAPVAEPQWEEAGTKKSGKSANSTKKEEKKTVPDKQAAKYPGAPAYKTVTLNKKSTKLKNKLVTFYEKYCPEKLYEFTSGLNDDLIQYYSQSANIHGLQTLNETLLEKYGADLNSM